MPNEPQASGPLSVPECRFKWSESVIPAVVLQDPNQFQHGPEEELVVVLRSRYDKLLSRRDAFVGTATIKLGTAAS